MAQNVITSIEKPHHCFFEESSFSIGMGGIIGLSEPEQGGTGRFYYNIRENICFGPEVALVSGGTHTLNEINFVLHYILDVAHFGAYPVIGASSIDTPETERDYGFLSGFGIHRNIKSFIIYAEYDHLFIEEGTDNFSLGVFYMFKL